jgi:hypothetical protein
LLGNSKAMPVIEAIAGMVQDSSKWCVKQLSERKSDLYGKKIRACEALRFLPRPVISDDPSGGDADACLPRVRTPHFEYGISFWRVQGDFVR